MMSRMDTRSRSRLLWTALMSLGLVVLQAGAVGAASQMTLYVGEVKVLRVKAVDRVAVGNGALLSTSITQDGQLILLAEGAGDTGIHIWYSDDTEGDLQITVEPSNTGREAREIAEFIESVDGVSTRTVAGKNVIEGTFEPRHEPILNAIIERYPDVLNLTRVSEVPRDRMVYFHVVISEFNTADISSLGVDWQTSIAGPRAVGGAGIRASTHVSGTDRDAAIAGLANDPSTPMQVLSATTNPAWGFFGIATSITSSINFMVEDNRALILAEPRLAARSGSKAEFLVGGEIPVVQQAPNSAPSTEYKPFGIQLEIEPIVDDQGYVRSRVKAEVSVVDRSLAVGNAPGFRSRSAETEVSMIEGETLVISGLIDRNLAQTVTGIPGFKDLPVLGRFFSNEGWNNRQSELVIFVTPTVVDAFADKNIAELDRQERMLEQFEEQTGHQLLLD